MQSKAPCNTGFQARMAAPLMGLNDCFQHPLGTLRNSGRYLLAGDDCSGKCSHIDFQSSKNTIHAYYLLIMGVEETTLYVWGGKYLYVFYPKTTRKMPPSALTLQKISIPPKFCIIWSWLHATHWPWTERYA